jgi:hypothetical protein
VIQSSTFRFPFKSLTTCRFKFTKLNIYLLLSMCLKLGVSHERKKLDKGVRIQGAEKCKAAYELQLIASPNVLRTFK